MSGAPYVAPEGIEEFLWHRIQDDEQVVEFAYQKGEVGSWVKRLESDCDAKRLILALWGDASEQGYTTAIVYLATTLKALALPYADHPCYEEAWKP